MCIHKSGKTDNQQPSAYTNDWAGRKRTTQRSCCGAGEGSVAAHWEAPGVEPAVGAADDVKDLVHTWPLKHVSQVI